MLQSYIKEWPISDHIISVINVREVAIASATNGVLQPPSSLSNLLPFKDIDMISLCGIVIQKGLLWVQALCTYTPDS